MNEKEAKKILSPVMRPDGLGLDCSRGQYIHWMPSRGIITLDGSFSPRQLEALAWWVKNKRQRKINKIS